MPFKLSRTERKQLRTMICCLESFGCPMQINGWRRICKRVPVYLNKKLGIVIKKPNFVLNRLTPLRVRVPTIKLDKNWLGWVAQPYCEKTNTKLATKLLRNELGNIHCDLHVGNVGWYMGKPMMFDW